MERILEIVVTKHKSKALRRILYTAMPSPAFVCESMATTPEGAALKVKQNVFRKIGSSNEIPNEISFVFVVIDETGEYGNGCTKE